jgi:hypothetical protein
LDVVNNPTDTRVGAPRKADGLSTTHYIGENGEYVTVVDATGEIIQVSDKNDPGWIMPCPK